jgi:hypothetical protein
LRAGIDYHHQNFATLAASTADELAKAQASIQPLTPG